jgi:hypothetical protein
LRLGLPGTEMKVIEIIGDRLVQGWQSVSINVWLRGDLLLDCDGRRVLGLARSASSRGAVIDRRIEGSIDRVTGAPAPHRDSSQREMPRRSGAFHNCGNGMRIQAAQSFERQGLRPSALGHDGRGRWIFANRILADRILANRSGSRRRRLSARQIGSGGSAQHRKGCSRCGQNLQHDVAPLKGCNNLVRADSARSNGKMPEQRQSHNEKGHL